MFHTVRSNVRRCLALLLLLACATGCDSNQRRVNGPYRLELFESKFFLKQAGVEETGGGCIEGAVDEIGWANGFIFARRYATYRGDPDGWMIIDVNKRSMTGPISETEFREKHPDVLTLPPEQAWKKL